MSTEKNLDKIIDLMRRDESVDAPADSVRWASNLFRTRATEPKTSLVQKIAAVLQMQIDPNKAAFGERSASATAVRQMLYRAGDNAIDIRIESAKNGFDVRGQLLGTDLTSVSIKLFDDAHSFETTTSETGEFRFEAVPVGSYELSIAGDGKEITLKALSIE